MDGVLRYFLGVFDHSFQPQNIYKQPREQIFGILVLGHQPVQEISQKVYCWLVFENLFSECCNSHSLNLLVDIVENIILMKSSILWVYEIFVPPAAVVHDIEENEKYYEVIVPHICYYRFPYRVPRELIPLNLEPDPEHLQVKQGIRACQVYFGQIQKFLREGSPLIPGF